MVICEVSRQFQTSSHSVQDGQHVHRILYFIIWELLVESLLSVLV